MNLSSIDHRTLGNAAGVAQARAADRVRRSPFDVRRSPFDVLRSPFDVLRSAFDVLRSAFFVRRSPFDVLRSPFAGLLLGCLVAGCSAPTAAPKPEPQPVPTEDGVVRIQDRSRQFVEVNEVSDATSGSTVTAPARVDFRDGAVSQVGAPLEGRIAAVHVLVGQKVNAGDSLVTLDCPEAASMRASAAVAQASLREARIELERQRRMQQEGVGIEREVVAAETKVSAAEAELARVEAGAISIGGGTASAVVVRAPIAGIVLVRNASVGMAVQRGGDPLVEIGDSSALWIVADVFERDLSHVHQGAITRTTFPSLNRDMAGRVTAIGTVVASGLRTAPVFLTVDAHGVALRPGMYGRVTIDSADAGLTVPVNAVLIKDGKDPVVYVQKDDLTFIRRRVVVAQPVDGRVQIVSGLTPGERVVVRGALLLDGAADQLL
jgi:cobalt-zinc-cadmium efflux system membrane fusion protein